MDGGYKNLFTVVTVTYNAVGVISPTLNSVREQSFQDYEYLVIDGASSDATLDAVRSSGIPNVRIVSEPDHGLYDAMNKAIDKAEGKYLIFLNAGDAFADANVLQRMADEAAKEPDIIYGQTQLVDEQGNVLGARHLTAPARLTMKSFASGMLVCHQAFVAKRSIMGHYDMQYRFSADYDWCIRCLKASKANAYLGEKPVISYLADGLSVKNRKKSLKERFGIMCKYYGTLPTVARHVGFAFRFAANKWRMDEAKKRLARGE